jgi:hypothetical protein
MESEGDNNYSLVVESVFPKMPKDHKESVNLPLSIGIALVVSIIIELQEYTQNQ